VGGVQVGYSTDGSVGVGPWVGDGASDGVSGAMGVGERTGTVRMTKVGNQVISDVGVGGRGGARARSVALSHSAPTTSAPASRKSNPLESSNRHPDAGEEGPFIGKSVPSQDTDEHG
jgi:hypothetical protein